MPVKNYPIDHLVLLYTCKLVLTSQKLIRMAHNYVVYVGLPFGILSLIHMNCTSYYSHSQHAILRIHISNVNPFILILHISDTHTLLCLSERPKANNYTHCRLVLQGWVHVPGVRRDKDWARAPVFKPAEERKWLFTHDKFCKKWYSVDNECEGIIEAAM